MANYICIANNMDAASELALRMADHRSRILGEEGHLLHDRHRTMITVGENDDVFYYIAFPYIARYVQGRDRDQYHYLVFSSNVPVDEANDAVRHVLGYGIPPNNFLEYTEYPLINNMDIYLIDLDTVRNAQNNVDRDQSDTSPSIGYSQDSTNTPFLRIEGTGLYTTEPRIDIGEAAITWDARNNHLEISGDVAMNGETLDARIKRIFYKTIGADDVPIEDLIMLYKAMPDALDESIDLLKASKYKTKRRKK